MIAIPCTHQPNCTCGATGCPDACTPYVLVYTHPEFKKAKVSKRPKKSYGKFLSSKINKRGRRK